MGFWVRNPFGRKHGWHHLVVVRNIGGGAVRVYLDGKRVPSKFARLLQKLQPKSVPPDRKGSQ